MVVGGWVGWGGVWCGVVVVVGGGRGGVCGEEGVGGKGGGGGGGWEGVCGWGEEVCVCVGGGRRRRGRWGGGEVGRWVVGGGVCLWGVGHWTKLRDSRESR